MQTEKHTVKIIEIHQVTHDVKCFRMEKPENYSFKPGQATEISINKPGWEEETRPFTFTNLPDEAYLEFTIKRYPTHSGVTNELHGLRQNDELILHEVFGAIHYEKPGIFIAGGAGVTPFISIFRQLEKDNQLSGNVLLFGNKTRADIILENEFKRMLGDNMINILSDEKTEEYLYGFVTREMLSRFIRKDQEQYIYVCGPDAMMDSVVQHLSDLKIPDKYIITEEF